MDRDARQRLLEFRLTALAQNLADAKRPAERRQRMKQMLVDNLPEAAHAGALDRARGTQRRIWKPVIEILVDPRRLGDNLAVMNEGRDLPVRIDREKLGRQMLALRQVEIV